MKKKRFKKIYIEITNICNLQCSFCIQTTRLPRVMTVEEFEKIILKIRDYTNLIALHVKGEPLLHPNLKQILDVCDKYKILVNITTNATLLYKNINILKNTTALRQLNLSLHSINKNEKVLDYNTKTYMEQIFNSVKILSETNKPYISYRLWNLEDFSKNETNAEIIELLEKEYGIQNLLEKAKINQFIELSDNIFLNQDLEFKWPSLDENIISENGKCWGLRNQLAILSNGDVVPCCLDQNGDIKLGNIFENEIEEIINSEYSKELVKGFENNKLIHNLCKRCGFVSKF